MLKRKARRMGSSLIITIPSQLAKMYNIKDGDKLKVEANSAGILICKQMPT